MKFILPSFFCYNSSSFWNSFIFGNAAYRQMIYIYETIITCIFLFYTLYLCVYFVSLLDCFCSLFCLFLNLLSSCLHTRYNVNVASYQIKSNQINLYASCCLIYMLSYDINISIYINIYIMRCTVVLRPRVTRPTEIACRTMAHASRQGKYPS